MVSKNTKLFFFKVHGRNKLEFQSYETKSNEKSTNVILVQKL
jgi:hypothetical protein